MAWAPSEWSYPLEIVDERSPTSAERNQAASLAKRLRHIAMPGVGVNYVKQVDPPGRLHKREAMRFMIEQERDVLYSTAKPFIRKQRTRGKYSAPKVAVMCDVSGSMHSNQPPLAVLRWQLTEAVHQIQGDVSVTLFGNYGVPIQLAGDRVTTVQQYNAPGSGENFSDGIAYVGADLDLFDDHDGARILVIITDGNFVYDGQPQWAREYMAECKRNDIAVLWINPNGRWRGPADHYGYGELVLGDRYADNPTKMLVDSVGDALIRQIQRVKTHAA